MLSPQGHAPTSSQDTSLTARGNRKVLSDRLTVFKQLRDSRKLAQVSELEMGKPQGSL